MQRIIYISAYRVGVFHYQNKQHPVRFYFDTTRDAQIKFRHYLMSTDNTAVNVLVDLDDEDFIKDTIPHVGPIDRKKIIQRTINRHYKKHSHYLHYTLIGRENNERRNDVIRYSLLRNPQALISWLDILTDCKISIRGIWSLPLLSEILLSKAEISGKNILLITQQQPGSLRQTFISNGIFQSSRLTSFEADEIPIGEFICLQVESTVQFLSNQRQIEFGQITEVHIICNNIDQTAIQSLCPDTSLYTFHYHNLEGTYHLVSGKFDAQINCTDIYTSICSTILLPVGHYGNADLFKYYYQRVLSKFIYGAGIFIFLFSMLYSLSLFSPYQSLSQQTHLLTQQSKQIDKLYNHTFKKIEPELATAKAMQSAVLFNHTINDYKSLSPLKFMSDISIILAESGAHNLSINHFSWQLYQHTKIVGQNNNSALSAIDYAKPQAIIQQAIIEGFIDSPRSASSAMQDPINTFVRALNKHPLIIEVNSKLENISDASNITSFSNANHPHKHNSQPQITTRFLITILMQGVNQVTTP